VQPSKTTTMRIETFDYQKRLIHVTTDDQREAWLDRDSFTCYLSAAGYFRQWPNATSLKALLTDYVIEHEIQLTCIEQVEDIRIEGMNAAPKRVER
jgi:hypothetical protein